MRLRSGIALIAFLAASPVVGQVDTLWVVPEVSPSIVKVGEPFTMLVRYPRTPGDSLQGPEAPGAVGSLDLRSSMDMSTSDSLVWRLEGALFELGDVQLPAIPFLLRRSQGPGLLVTRPYLMTVEATAPDTARVLKGIKPPISTPLRWEWFMVLGFFMGLALLVGAVWFWRKHRLDPEPWISHIPLDPPHIEAHKALTELEREAFPARGLVQEHYFRLSGILRVYMERRFGFPAAEWTTQEITPALQQISILSDSESAGALEVLHRADLAKFAKANPGPEVPAEDLRRVRAWVDQTAERGIESDREDPL